MNAANLQLADINSSKWCPRLRYFLESHNAPHNLDVMDETYAAQHMRRSTNAGNRWSALRSRISTLQLRMWSRRKLKWSSGGPSEEPT